jgi:hypothetical protein
VHEAIRLAPPALRHNLNGLVKTALNGYVKARREKELEKTMEQMAHDLMLVKENRKISQEFRGAEEDGLP